RRHLSLAEFYSTYAASGVDNVDELLRTIDLRLLEDLRKRLGYESSDQHAKDWWLAFEEANKTKTLVVIELAHELLRRSGTIQDFFSTYVHSDCNSVPEILNLLDQMIAKRRSEEAVVSEALQQQPPADRFAPESMWASAPLEQQIEVTSETQSPGWAAPESG